MNELEKILRARVIIIEPDRRYRILVNLQRADRPRYWNFLCNNCGAKVVELQNYEIVGANDFYDPQNLNNHAVGKHCKGTEPNGLPCKYSYFFNLQ